MIFTAKHEPQMTLWKCMLFTETGSTEWFHPCTEPWFNSHVMQAMMIDTWWLIHQKPERREAPERRHSGSPHFSFHRHLPVEDKVKDHRCLCRSLWHPVSLCVFSFFLFSAKPKNGLSVCFGMHCNILSTRKITTRCLMWAVVADSWELVVAFEPIMF